MIATTRRMPLHDFLLVACSVAVIVLANWPVSQPRQWFQLRQTDGSLRQYSLAEDDSNLSRLRLSLQEWARAGQQTRLGLAQWRSELSEFYLQRLDSEKDSSFQPIRTVAYDSQVDGHENHARRTRDDDVHDEAAMHQQARRQYWTDLGQRAREEIVEIHEIRRSRKAMEVPPPIVFGQLEPGRKPAHAVFVSALVGISAGFLFFCWSWFVPTLTLERSGTGAFDDTQRPSQAGPNELQLSIPSDWVRVRQPAGVLARWVAMATLAIMAFCSAVI